MRKFLNVSGYLIAILLGLVFLGCANQQAHERAMEELEMTSQNSAQEIERLQGIVKKQQAQVVQLQEEAQQYEGLKESLVQAQRTEQEVAAREAMVKAEVVEVREEIERIIKAQEQSQANGPGKSLAVTQFGDRLVLTVLGHVLFGSGQANLTSQGEILMGQIGEILARLPHKIIQVEGHTDQRPITGHLKEKFPTNWELSTTRATSVLRFLIDHTGMAPELFSAVGYADTRSVISNDTAEGRAKNRRVEIVLFPEGVVQTRQTKDLFPQ